MSQYSEFFDPPPVMLASPLTATVMGLLRDAVAPILTGTQGQVELLRRSLMAINSDIQPRREHRGNGAKCTFLNSGVKILVN